MTKRLALANLPAGSARPLIPGLVNLDLVRNSHGAMGLFGDRPAILIALAVAVVFVLVMLLRDILGRSAVGQIGFGLILGGAIGNVVDRLVHHYVIDFIAPRGFYVVNVGDVCVTVGAMLVAYAGLRPARS